MQWPRIIARIRASRSRRWAIRFLYILVFLALFGSFLANDRPLITKYQGKIRWPVFRQIGEDILGWNPYTDLPGNKWINARTDWVVWPPIPYAASTLDRKNNNYRSPLGEQRIESWRWRHWLGTDKLGRDVLAGIIKGSRTALLVGIVAMSVALLLGLFIGGIAGYFGNDLLRYPRWKVWAWWLGLLLGGSYVMVVFYPTLRSTAGWLSLTLSLLVIGLIIAVCWGLCYFVAKVFPWLRPSISVRVDSIALRIIELFNSVPALVLLITILGLIEQPTILTVMLIIGLIRWTGIARFVRAELLRIRQLPYLEAARLSGLPHWRILLRHALPNTLGPVIVAVAFGMAGAVILEAFLAFLGLGLPPEEVSWGSLLLQARGKASAWWLTVFPGLAIFLTVLSLNLLGEALRE
ncbi:MAG: ABC transporter permease [Bacteroidota bacterium]